ncbi:hypothetical protein T440DRAFT_515357 [Plenodomus tracheiphilus IPT5]|uniref:Uncharacterized protein n=1 Tax=Plenodomus tracheiphilus IPT5 TaxID=1408161 RepID=A0A6A7BEN4_9PLEO|nr:hypothetical protein T440DRAFT_515357 [Plenodomus tracheiphilus IPT5]
MSDEGKTKLIAVSPYEMIFVVRSRTWKEKLPLASGSGTELSSGADLIVVTNDENGVAVESTPEIGAFGVEDPVGEGVRRLSEGEALMEDTKALESLLPDELIRDDVGFVDEGLDVNVNPLGVTAVLGAELTELKDCILLPTEDGLAILAAEFAVVLVDENNEGKNKEEAAAELLLKDVADGIIPEEIMLVAPI